MSSIPISVSSYLTVQISDRWFCIPTISIKEVCPPAPRTRIPTAGKIFSGYSNIRSNIYLILDLTPSLGLTPSHDELRQPLILFRDSIGPTFGIEVDRVGEITHISEDRFQTIGEYYGVDSCTSMLHSEEESDGTQASKQLRAIHFLNGTFIDSASSNHDRIFHRLIPESLLEAAEQLIAELS
jgi:chemotaxis signal transduction protein